MPLDRGASLPCYALRHGYGFMAQAKLMWPADIREPRLTGHWTKVTLLQRWLRDADYVFWADDDTVLVNMNRSMDEWIDIMEAGGYHLLVPQDKVDNRKFGSYAFLARASPEGRRFADLWWDYRDSVAGTMGNGDQNAMRSAIVEWVARETGQWGSTYGADGVPRCRDVSAQHMNDCYLDELTKLGFPGEGPVVNKAPIYFTPLSEDPCDTGLALIDTTPRFADRTTCLSRAFLVHVGKDIEDSLFDRLLTALLPDRYVNACESRALDGFLQNTTDWMDVLPPDLAALAAQC